MSEPESEPASELPPDADVDSGIGTGTGTGIGAGAGATAPRVGDAKSRKRLWARLLAGRVTEVCVLSYRGLSRDLPQTLGLEVIDYFAYLYDSSGVARAPMERARLAQELAAEPRWLAVGGPRYWVDAFAQRAEAIVVMPSFRAEMDLALSRPISTAVDSVDRYLTAVFTRQRRSRRSRRLPGQKADGLSDQFGPMVGRLGPVREYSGDGPMSDADIGTHYIWMRNYLVGEFPSKTFVLTSRAQVKQLRAVRAVRRT